MATVENDDLLKRLMDATPGQGHIEYQRPEQPAAKAAQRVQGYERAKPRRTAPRLGGLFDRSSTDRARPIVVGVLAFLFIVLSWVGTVTQTGVALAAGNILVTPRTALAIGLTLALLITVCEIVFSESVWYWPFLVIDMALTLWWMWPAMLAWSSGMGAGPYGALVAGGMIGAISAYLPERVLFGHRRK